MNAMESEEITELLLRSAMDGRRVLFTIYYVCVYALQFSLPKASLCHVVDHTASEHL